MRHILVALITIAIVTGKSVDTFMAALMYFNLGTFVHITVQWFIGFVRTISHFIAHEMIINALSIRTGKLSGCARCISLFITTRLIGPVATIVLTCFADAYVRN